MIERACGALHILPVAWTDLELRAYDESRRLKLEGLLVLAKWVADRLKNLGTELAIDDQREERRPLRATEAADHAGDARARVVVGKAGPPSTRGRGRRN